MKKLLLILLCLPILIYSQSQEEQVVVKYSAEYKLPLMKRMLKNTLPESYTVYYSESAYRVEFSNSFGMLGIEVEIEGIQVNDYKKLKSLMMVNMIATKETQSKDTNTTEHTLEDILIDTTSKITYTKDEKVILGNKCVGFLFENKDSKMEGFLTTNYSAIGAIIEGMDYGLPMYLKQYDKTEKVTEFLTVESVEIEALKESYYIID